MLLLMISGTISGTIFQMTFRTILKHFFALVLRQQCHLDTASATLKNNDSWLWRGSTIFWMIFETISVTISVTIVWMTFGTILE
jgi:phage-related holin